MEYINPDDIRQELTGDATNHTNEVQVWETVHSRLIETLMNNMGVIVDATYSKIRDRRKLIELCKQNGAKEIIGYWFNPPLETCIIRNAKRQRVVPEDVIVKMHNRLKLHPPTKQEGFSEIIEINS